MKGGGLLTAPEVAKHCNADLKTIHNWVNAGKIKFFRTPGRHLRFHVEDVIEFLNEFGYPVPLELELQARPKVMMITRDEKTGEALQQKLGARARVFRFECPVKALLAIGREDPSVVVIDSDHPDVDVENVVARLTEEEAGSHLVIVFSSEGNGRDLVETLTQYDSVTLSEQEIGALKKTVIEMLTRARELREAAAIE